MPEPATTNRFTVALSFPGEHRKYVRNVAARLEEKLGRNRVFFDDFHPNEILGKDADLKLRKVYRERSDFVVPFFSEHYEKRWCKIEWSAIRAMLSGSQDGNVVLPVQLDGTLVPGWENIDIAIRKRNKPGWKIADEILSFIEHHQAKKQPPVSQPDIAPVRRPTNLPISIGSLFKGRDAFLQTLRESLLKSGATAVTTAQAIHGLGGIGKTRVAIEYGHRYAEEYSATLILSADVASPDDLDRNLAELTAPHALDLPEHAATDLIARRDAVLRWLRDHPGWLLIIDNVDSAEAAAAIDPLLQQLLGGHILITSRRTRWKAHIQTLSLDVLALEDAVDFLLERTQSNNKAQKTKNQARALAQELDGLALALEQAAAYIAERQISFDEYLKRFAEQKARVLEWHDEELMNYPASVAVTWQTSFDQLSPDARHLLNLLSFLASEPVPRGLVEMDRSGIRQNFDKSDAEGDSAIEILANSATEESLLELRALSLVRFLDDPPHSFLIHRLVMEIVRFRLDDDDEGSVVVASSRQEPSPAAQRRLEATTTSAFEALLTLLNAWRPNDGQDISTWAKWEAFAPHAEAVFDRTERRQDPESALGLLANFAGFETCRNAAYARAEPLMRRALAGSEREFGPDATHTLTSVNNLGFLLQTRGDLDGAEPLFRRDLEASERVLGPEHPATLISVNNLGLLLQERGDLDGAEPLYRRALEASERVLGPEHPDTLSSVNNLGFLRYLRGDMDGAEPLYRRAYEGCQQSLGDDHPTTKIYRRNWEICVAEMKEKSGEE